MALLPGRQTGTWIRERSPASGWPVIHPESAQSRRENLATSRLIGRIRALRNQVCAKPTFPRKPGLVPVSPGWRGSPERRPLYAPAKKV
jgi:hypothetical protein